jgi:hypothetical protein
MKKTSKIEITELFLVKADWHRTFMGEIIRETTDEGKEFVRGNVVINEGKAWSTGNTQSDLANNLDYICTMKLDGGLHDNSGVTSIIAETPFNHN